MFLLELSLCSFCGQQDKIPHRMQRTRPALPADNWFAAVQKWLMLKWADQWSPLIWLTSYLHLS
ncbi:hypothetical protein OESDEN_03257 [Oesophagostomum dentatum]|uniref:Uncharacterized protein n=1 Tax=Oesophagostomum dentatum TaxID=61180 RepID=A0A0B1TLS3_OESDE|nr:hypothetical protein OESDEN_03257 [Oesophagostomum dentatum]